MPASHVAAAAPPVADVEWLKKQPASLGLVLFVVLGIAAVIGGAFSVVLGAIWVKLGEVEKGVYASNERMASLKTSLDSTSESMKDLKAEMNQIAPRSMQLPPAPAAASSTGGATRPAAGPSRTP